MMVRTTLNDAFSQCFKKCNASPCSRNEGPALDMTSRAFCKNSFMTMAAPMIGPPAFILVSEGKLWFKIENAYGKCGPAPGYVGLSNDSGSSYCCLTIWGAENGSSPPEMTSDVWCQNFLRNISYCVVSNVLCRRSASIGGAPGGYCSKKARIFSSKCSRSFSIQLNFNQSSPTAAGRVSG